MKPISRGFSLVELIVVMTVLAILSTIVGVYILGNISESRDAARIQDISNIVTSLELYKTENATLPVPDDVVNIVYSGSIAWKQGVMGTGALSALGNFGDTSIVDPKFSNYYTYSTTNNQREYQISAIMENINDSPNLGNIIGLVPQANAAQIDTAYTLGNYNGFMVRTASGALMNLIATPSIISTDITTSTDILDIILNKKLVYHEFFNLPSSYSGYIDNLNGGFNFNVVDPIIFSGSVDDLKYESALLALNQKLKYVYAVTPTESFDKYISILQEDGLNKIKNFLTKYYKIYFRSYFNCFDIKSDGADDGNGYYTIDSDGIGGQPPYQVYCDMTMDEYGWTRKGDNQITNGDFVGGNPVSTEWGSTPVNTIVNLGVGGIPILGTDYALHQTGTSDSKYQITMNDLSLIKSGDKIVLTAWFRDDDNSVSWNTCTTASCNQAPSKGYIFHNRIFYSDGTSDVNGVMQLLDTKVTADGRTWHKYRVTTTARKSVVNFYWYVGYGAEGTKDLYFTGLQSEIFYK